MKNLPEAIEVGQIMRVRVNREETIVQLVQYAPTRLQLISVESGNRYYDNIHLPLVKPKTQRRNQVLERDIASAGFEIIEFLDNPFKGML